MCILIIIGKQILEHSYDEIKKDILSGTVDEDKAVGESLQPVAQCSMQIEE